MRERYEGQYRGLDRTEPGPLKEAGGRQGAGGVG